MPQTPFQWPPRKPPSEALPPVPSEVTIAVPEKCATDVSWWSRIERVWLDPIAEPLEQRAASHAWKPDDPSQYCNRCGRSIGAFENDEFGCERCRNQRLPWQRFVRLGSYETPLSEWICDVKFTRWGVLGTQLGRWLGCEIRRAGLRTDDRDHPVVVVPVATSLIRRMSRGIDHAAMIAAGVAGELRVPVVKALGRKHRPSQRAVPHGERGRNVSGSFYLRRPGALVGKTVILVDDVMTTSATLRAASRVLADLPGETKGIQGLWGCVLGVTPEHDRPGLDRDNEALQRTLEGEGNPQVFHNGKD